MFSNNDAGDPSVAQDGSDAALPRRIHAMPKDYSAKAHKEASDRITARYNSLHGEVVTYRKGDPKPDLPPGQYDYETEGDRW